MSAEANHRPYSDRPAGHTRLGADRRPIQSMGQDRTVTDEIYDYFGGNSSRKVEPLDESELFENEGDDQAEKASSGTSEIVESIEVTETIEIVATSQSLVVEAGSGQQDGSSKADPKKPEQPSRSRTASPGKPAADKSNSKQTPAKTAGPAFGAGLFDESGISQQDNTTGGTADESAASGSPGDSGETGTENSPSQSSELFASDSKTEDGSAALSEMFVPSPFDSFENDQTPGGEADDVSAGQDESITISEDGEEIYEFDVEDLEDAPEQGTPRRRRNRQQDADGQGEGRGRPRGESRERPSDSQGSRRSRNSRGSSRESAEDKDNNRRGERPRNKRDFQKNRFFVF